MNIWAEKIEVIKRFEQVNDAFIIQAIKDLLDFTRSKTDQALETALYHTLKQSEQREVRSLEEIMPEIRKRFKG